MYTGNNSQHSFPSSDSYILSAMSHEPWEEFDIDVLSMADYSLSLIFSTMTSYMSVLTSAHCNKNL